MVTFERLDINICTFVGTIFVAFLVDDWVHFGSPGAQKVSVNGGKFSMRRSVVTCRDVSRRFVSFLDVSRRVETFCDGS